MGAHNSHEAIPSNGSPDSSPNPEARARILSLDPRSPNNDITRTPIVVEKTPEGTLQDPLDPRSPTIGIDRTPLTALPTSKTAIQRATDIVTQRLEMGEEDNDHEQTDGQETQMIHPSKEIDTLGVTGIEDITLDDFPTSESTRLVASSDRQVLDLTEKTRLKKKKPKNSQPKELFPSKKSSNNNAGLKDVTRSPLSTRTLDMNSPLQIVQRKQMKDLDKKMTCAQENAMSRFIVRDKENM